MLYLCLSLPSTAIAIGTLVPHAHGAGNDILVGRYLQLSMLLFTFLSLPAIVVWCFYTYEAVLWFGFDEETATISQNFAYPFLVIMFLGGLDHPVHEFLDVTGHEKYSTVVNILYYAAQTLSIFVVVSFGVTDLVYIGIVQAFLGLIMSVSNLAYVLYRGWLDDYWEGFVKTLSLRVRNAFGRRRSHMFGMHLTHIVIFLYTNPRIAGLWES